MDAEILKLGKEIRLKGKELPEFFKESKERAAVEDEKVRAEAERIRIAQKESEERAERAAERVRIAQKESEERAAAEAEKVREFELKKIELQLRSGISKHTTTLDKQSNCRVEDFELAPFIDGEDDIYQYIENFERVAQINEWNPSHWGMYLAVLLTGEALGIYARMPSHEANDYFKLKRALLPKFDSAENKCRLTKEERNSDSKVNFGKELAVSHPASGSESFQQITYSQEFPMKGENSLSENFAEREEPLSLDLPILPTLPEWEKNKDEVSSSSEALREQDKREESSVSSNVLSWADNTLSSKRLSNQSITISSETESKIGQPRMEMSEFESESDVEFNMFDRKSTTEEKEGHEHDLPVTTSRDRSSRNKKRTNKKPYLECEKDSQLYLSQDKHNSENLDKGPMVNQDDISNQREMRNEMEFDVNVDSKFDDNLQEYSTENQGVNISNQQRMQNKKKFVYVSPKFSVDHINVSIEEIAKFRVEEEKRFDTQSEEENKQMVNQSHTVIPSKEINDFKISHELEPEEENSVEGSNIVAISELTFKSEDMKVESDNHLSFSSSSSSSPYFSSSLSNSVEENKIKEKKKIKMIYRKRKRKGDNNNNDYERCDSNYKCDIGTTCKNLMIRTQLLKSFKYRRKGKASSRRHQEIREKTESESRIWRRARLISNRLHNPDKELNVVLSCVSLKHGCHQVKNNSFIEDERYENVFVSLRKNKMKSDILLESSASKTKRLENFMRCSNLIVLGLLCKTTEKELRVCFELYCRILMEQVKKDPQTGQSKGFDFIRYASWEVQQRFLDQRHMIDGRICDVNILNSLERAEWMVASEDNYNQEIKSIDDPDIRYRNGVYP